MHVPNRTSTAHSLQRFARCQRFLSRPTSVALTVLFLGLIPLSSGAKAETAGIAVRIDDSATQLLAQNNTPASPHTAAVKSTSSDQTTSTATVSNATDSTNTAEGSTTADTTSDSTTTTTQPASAKESAASAASTANTAAASTASTGTFADNSSSGTKLGSASFGSLGQNGTNHKGVLADGGLTSPGGIAKWLLSTIVVLGFIFLAGYWLKRSRFVRAATSTMQLETQISLGPKERIVQMRVGERHLLLGVTAHNINLLLDLNAPTAPAPVAQASHEGAAPRAAAPRRVPTSRTQAKRYEADEERDFSCQALARDDYAADYYDNPIERSLHEHEQRDYDYDERRRDYDHDRDYDRKRRDDRAYRCGAERGDASRHDYTDYERDLPQFADEYDDERYAQRAAYRDSRRDLSLVDDLPFEEESTKRSRHAARSEYEHDPEAETDTAHDSAAPATATASNNSHNILAGDAQATAILRAGVNDDGDDVPSAEAAVSGTDTSPKDNPSQAQEVANLSSTAAATANASSSAADACDYRDVDERESRYDDDAAYEDSRHHKSYSRYDEEDEADAYEQRPYDPDYAAEDRAEYDADPSVADASGYESSSQRSQARRTHRKARGNRKQQRLAAQGVHSLPDDSVLRARAARAKRDRRQQERDEGSAFAEVFAQTYDKTARAASERKHQDK